MSTITLIGRWAGETGWAGGPWWLLIPLLILAAVAMWAVLRGRRTSAGADATSILSARYARGEIDTDEYRQRRDELKGLR